MKKVISILLCMTLILGMTSIMPTSVFAAETKDDDVGVYSDFAQPSGSINSGYDCVAYARARFKEVFGFELHNTGGNNAMGYYSNASYWGDTVSSVPKSGTLAVWDYGNVGYSHVAFVEKVVGNTVYLTHGGWSGTGYHEESRNLSSMGNVWPNGTSYQNFLGFVYVKGASTVHTCNHNNFKYSWQSHPHYNVYACSICGKEWTDYNSSNYSGSCSECNHTVTFNANGGTGAPAAQTKKFKSALKISSTVPTRTNYEFLGWATSADSTDIAYRPGASYTADRNQTLYAVWKQLGYSIKLDMQGGTYTGQTEILVPFISSAPLPSDAPTKQYHKFLGWSRTPDSDTPDYLAGDTLTPDMVSPYADSNKSLTLYAAWEKPTVIQADQQVNFSVKPGDVKYYIFTPSESGNYTIKRDNTVQNQDHNKRPIYCYSDNLYYVPINGKLMLHLESGKPVYFEVENSNDSLYDNGLIVERSSIEKVSVKSLAPLYYNESTPWKYDSYYDYPLEISLYDKNNSLLFNGTKEQLYNLYGLELKSNTLDIPGPGDYKFTITVGSGNILTEMPVTILSGLTGISVNLKEEIPIILGCADCKGSGNGVRQTLKGVDLVLHYADGTTKTVDISSEAEVDDYSGAFRYNNKFINVSLEGEPKLGYNTATVSYMGYSTTYQVKCEETPIKTISVLSAPSIPENEYLEFTTYDSQYSVDAILKDQPIKLKISYKDGTAKTVLFDELYGTPESLKQGGHTVLWTGGGFSTTGWKVNGENIITLSYMGKSVDVYVDITESENGLDKLVDFEVLSIPNFDENHFWGIYLNMENAKIKMIFESGKEIIVTPYETGLNYAFIMADKNKYYFQPINDANGNVVWQLGSIRKTLFPKCPNSLVSAKIIGAPETTSLQNSMFEFTFSDGKVIYAKSDSYNRYYRIVCLDIGIYLSYKEGQNDNLEYKYGVIQAYTSSEIIPITIDNNDYSKAKAIAYNIGKNTNLKNSYSLSNISNEDIDELILSCPYFSSYDELSETKSEDYVPFRSIYGILYSHYGLTKNEICNTKYYNEQYNILSFPEPRQIKLGYDSSISLYKQTATSYIFKYSDENKTQYIEISKDLMLLSVSDKAPEGGDMHNVNMTGGYCTADKNISGQTVTVCVNTPKGKRFAGWTCDNPDVTFADAKSVETTFVMPGKDVTVTPVFLDIPDVRGDANGDGIVSILDVTTIQQQLADLETMDKYEVEVADIDGDGELTITDASKIQVFIAKLVDEL